MKYIPHIIATIVIGAIIGAISIVKNDSPAPAESKTTTITEPASSGAVVATFSTSETAN